MKFYFLAVFRKIVKNLLFIKMTAFFLPVCSKYSILYILFSEMKVHSYARNMNLNRNMKKVCRNTKT